jgi:hypothetical protein
LVQPPCPVDTGSWNIWRFMKTASPAETVPLVGAPDWLAEQLLSPPWNVYWKSWALLFNPGVNEAPPSSWQPPTEAAVAAGANDSSDATTTGKARKVILRNMHLSLQV